jgi:hypothetical protein
MLTKLILPLSCIPVFAAAIYAAVIYRQLRDEFRIFSWFLFLSGIVQFFTLILWWFELPNLVYFHLYIVTGFCCLAWFYKTVLRELIHPTIFVVLIVVFTLFAAGVFLMGPSRQAFASISSTTEAALIIIFSLSTFLLTQNEIVRKGNLVELRGLNWINSGLFIFYTSTILLYYFGDLIIRSFPPHVSRYSWAMHSFFSVIMYTCFYIGLWKCRKK